MLNSLVSSCPYISLFPGEWKDAMLWLLAGWTIRKTHNCNSPSSHALEKPPDSPDCGCCHHICPSGWLGDSSCTRKLLCMTEHSWWWQSRGPCQRWRRTFHCGRSWSHLEGGQKKEQGQGVAWFRCHGCAHPAENICTVLCPTCIYILKNLLVSIQKEMHNFCYCRQVKIFFQVVSNP